MVRKKLPVIVVTVAIICILAVVVRYGGFGFGMYSNQIVTNVAYADEKHTASIGLTFEYEVKGEEKVDLPIQISDGNTLTVDSDIQFVEQGDLLLIIKDSAKKERFSMKLPEGKKQSEINLPKGNYQLEILMKEGIGSGEITWKGIENEDGS